MTSRTSRGFALRSFLLLLVLAGAVFYYLKTSGRLDQYFAKPLLAEPTEMSGSSSENQILGKFRDLKFSCNADNSGLGDRACWSPISAYNGIPARDVVFFFDHNRLAHMRVTLDASSHAAVSGQLHAKYGPTRQFGTNRDRTGSAVVGWMLANGTLAMNETVAGPDDEVTVLWTSKEVILARLTGTNP